MDNRGMNTLCRLCLCFSVDLTDVLDGYVEPGFTIKDTIEDLLRFKVTEVDGSPWWICSSCIEKLNDFRLFKSHCIESKVTYETQYKLQEYPLKIEAYEDYKNCGKKTYLALVGTEENHNAKSFRKKDKCSGVRGVNDSGSISQKDIKDTGDGQCTREIKIEPDDGSNDVMETNEHLYGEHEETNCLEEMAVDYVKKENVHSEISNENNLEVILTEECDNSLNGESDGSHSNSHHIWVSSVVCSEPEGNYGEMPMKHNHLNNACDSCNNQELHAWKNEDHRDSQCLGCDTVMAVPKRKVHRSKSMTLEQKLKIIKRLEAHERAVDIARDLSIPPTTVRSIFKNANALKSVRQNVSSSVAAKVIRIRSNVMERMEKLLASWIKEQNQQHNPLSMKIIMDKALTLHATVKQEEGEGASKETFTASRGWFNRFKRRVDLRSMKMHVSGASANRESEEECHSD